MNDSMKIEINAMFKDLISSPIDNNKISLYAILDGIRYVSKAVTDDYLTQEMIVLYQIKNSDSYPSNEISSCDIIEQSSAIAEASGQKSEMLQKDTKLAGILSRVPTNAGDQILLVTWDHGSAFGIFREFVPGIQEPVIRTPIDNNLSDYPFLELFWKKAMENEGFQNFVNLKKVNTVSWPIVQLEHKVFKISPPKRGAGFLVGDLKSSSQILNLFKAEKTQNGLKLVRSNTHSSTKSFSNKKSALNELTNLLPDTETPLEFDLGSEEVPEILKNKELASTIEKWLAERSQRKVSVLLMMNCWQMNLHTLFALKDTVRYIVAPQGGIDNPGYNYREILLALSKEGDELLKADVLCKEIINSSKSYSFQEKASILNPKFPQTIEQRAIFAIKLDDKGEQKNNLGEVITIIDQLSRQLIVMLSEPRGENVKNLFKYLRLFSFDFTGGDSSMIDIATFFTNLSSNSEGLPFVLFDADFKALIDRFVNTASYNNYIIKSYRGKSLFSNQGTLSTDQLTGRTPTGLSLFFPQIQPDPKVLDNVKDDPLLIEMLENWVNLITMIYPDIL